MAKKRADAVAPSSADVKARLQRAMSEGKFQTALELAKQIVRFESTPEHRQRLIECYLGRARQLIDQGSTRDAATVLDVGVAHANSDPAALAKFAEELARCGEVQRALQVQEWIPEPRPASRVLVLAVDAAMQRGAAGRALLPEALQSDFDVVRQAFAQVEQGQDDAARESVQGIGLSSPFLEWKVFLRGISAYYQNDDARALDNWSRLEPARLPARVAAPLRAQIDPTFAAAQSPATQNALRQQASRLQSNVVLTCLRSLNSALAQARGKLMPVFREAEALLPHLKQLHPERVERLARCLYWEIVEQGTVEDHKRYVRLFGQPPDDPEFFRLWALVLESIPSYREANEAWERYEKWLADAPRFTAAERARARAMIWLRMGDNASKHQDVDEFAQRLRRMPFSPRTEPPKPLNPPPEQCYRRAVDLAKDWLTPNIALIETLHQNGKRQLALAAMSAALEQFPDHVPTLERAAQLFAEAGEHERAISMLARAVRQNPLNESLSLQLEHARRQHGTRLAALGEFDAARALFQAVWDQAPQESHLLVDAAWAACEFKAKYPARAEELLIRAANAPDDGMLAGWMYAQATFLKLPKPIKSRFEKPLVEALEAENPTAEQIAPLLTLFSLLEQEGLEYRGAKSHRKKALAQIEKTAGQPYSEELMRRVGLGVMAIEGGRLLRRLVARWKKDHRQSPWPVYFEMESYLTTDERRWPLWRVEPMAKRAKALAEKLPADPIRDTLIAALDLRLRQFRELNPFAAMFGAGEPFFGFNPEDEESW